MNAIGKMHAPETRRSLESAPFPGDGQSNNHQSNSRQIGAARASLVITATSKNTEGRTDRQTDRHANVYRRAEPLRLPLSTRMFQGKVFPYSTFLHKTYVQAEVTVNSLDFSVKCPGAHFQTARSQRHRRKSRVRLHRSTLPRPVYESSFWTS